MGGAVVTGAGRGIGRAVAVRLARRGLAVGVTDIDGEAAERAATEIGGGAWHATLDVTDAEACRWAAREAADRSGGLEVWVNNAGILSTGVVYEQDPALQRAMLEVNAVGTFNGTLAALGLMRPADRGQIINIVSLAGIVAAPGEVAYSASKHAAMAFTLGTLFDLRRSGLKGIRISAVCPDGVWSPMIADRLDDPDAFGSFSGQMLTADQVAERVESLLDHPRAVLTIPRWRGFAVRIADLFPGLGVRILPLLVRDARRRQRRLKARVERGDWPPGA